MIYRLISKFLFIWDAEAVHHLTCRLMIVTAKIAPIVLRWAGGSAKGTPVSVLGMHFRNPIGLAAGFDKNGELMGAIDLMGFGFIEIGGVTPRPQFGNPKPRLWRNAKERWIFNRMGFNNDGAPLVAQRVRQYRSKGYSDLRIGLNLGKNKDTPSENAAQDYVEVARTFNELVDFLVINVSSPNTPGLRDLQAPAQMSKIVTEVRSETLQWTKKCPVLVKIAPEIDLVEMKELVGAAERAGCEGWVLTNTQKSQIEYSAGQKVDGGRSGSNLSEISRQRLVELRSVTQLPIISVGGILSVEEAKERLALGASLIQVYSGLIFRGPSFVGELVRGVFRD